MRWFDEDMKLHFIGKLVIILDIDKNVCFTQDTEPLSQMQNMLS